MELWIAPDGSDASSGSADQPLATVARARDLARQSGQPNNVVHMLGGRYPLATPLQLDARDDGLIIRRSGAKPVVISGGQTLRSEDFHPVTDPAVRQRLPEEARDHVRCCDLSAYGITRFGYLHRATPDRPAPLELFIDHEPMDLARWPNDGQVPILEVLDPGAIAKIDGYKDRVDTSNRGGAFRFDFDRAQRWRHARDIHLDGYFHFGWYQDVLPVDRIDFDEKVFHLGAAHLYGIRGIHDDAEWNVEWSAIRRYHVFNLLEEIDRPGEWYLDRETGVLYVWPPTELADARIEVSVLDGPMVTLQDATGVRLEGLTLEYGRHHGVVIAGGAHCALAGCTLRYLGGMGASITGTGHRVESCDVHGTGVGGISIAGGDRRTLTPSQLSVTNCHIFDYNRRNRGTGINLGGVGVTVGHNWIHDAPHRAISFHGNNHLIELNRIERVATAGDDVGATGLGRNPSERGTILRHNLFSCIGTEPGNVTSVYLDDGTCGITLTGNIFHRAATGNRGAIFSNGGSDLTITQNLFVDTKLGVNLSDCFKTWAAKRLVVWTREPDGDWVQSLKHEVDIHHPAWARQYPELVDFFSDDPGTPKRNVFSKNITVRSTPFAITRTPEHDPLPADRFVRDDNHHTDDPAVLADLDQRGFDLGDTYWLRQVVPGFEPVPVDRIGLESDAWRRLGATGGASAMLGF